jgi:hypothetical protein
MAINGQGILEGTVVNGVVVVDGDSRLPEGARVRLRVVAQPEDADEDDPELDKLIAPDPSLPPDHPLAPYNREIELAILRESIEDMKAGRSRPFEEAMAEIAAKHKLPPAQTE